MLHHQRDGSSDGVFPMCRYIGVCIETCQRQVPTLWCDFYSRFRVIWFLKIGFSPKASGFCPFGDATDLAGESGVGDVVWLIQAPAWNQTCHSTNDRCEALASPKGCFLCFCFSPPVFFYWAPHSTIPPHPKKTYENRFTNTNNHPQFIQIISKLRFFSQSSQHCGPQPCELSFFSLPL